MNSTSSLPTIISLEERPNTDRFADTDKMHESSFSITTINNLLKLAGTVEALFGCYDGIIVELDEAKLGSCSYGWVRSAFGCETRLPALFFFVGANFLRC